MVPKENGSKMIIRGLFLGLFLLGSVDANSHEATNKNKSLNSAETSTGKKVVWSPETDQITCCNNGVPTVPENLVRNFTIIPSDYTIEERTVDDVAMNCRDYDVRYWAQRSPVLSDSDNEFNEEIKLKCKCSESLHTLDSNCRRLPSCKNNGFRAPNSPHHCICPTPFFGDRCEKYCDQGQRLKSHTGKNYCSCVPYYQGEECRDLVCLNGGREENGRCVCLQQYLGYHCEINTNHSGPGGSRFQRFGDQSSEMFTRDVSGTIFSLIMIVVLIVSMYLLMKHRMQTRYLNRRSDLLGACNFPVPTTMTITGGPGSNHCLSAGRPDLISPDDPRLYTFRPFTSALPDNGPPPYQSRGRRSRDVLPPLPSYEDATKLPTLMSNIPNDESVEETTELSARSERNESNQQANHGSVEQISSTPETIVATIRGNEIVRPVNRQVDSSNQDAETVSINSTATASSESSINSNASKPEQR